MPSFLSSETAFQSCLYRLSVHIVWLFKDWHWNWDRHRCYSHRVSLFRLFQNENETPSKKWHQQPFVFFSCRRGGWGRQSAILWRIPFCIRFFNVVRSEYVWNEEAEVYRINSIRLMAFSLLFDKIVCSSSLSILWLFGMKDEMLKAFD